MDHLLTEIGNYVVIANFLALFIALYCKVSDKSAVMTITTLCVLNGLMQWLGYFFESKYGVWDKNLIRHMFYLTFACFELFGVYMLLIIHRYFEIEPQRLARFVSFAFVAAAIVIMFKYIVRMHISDSADLTVTDFELLTEFVYQHAIPTINISTALIVICIVVRLVYNRKKGLING